MKIRVSISWLLVLLCLLLSGRPVRAQASGLKVQYFPLPGQAIPFYPTFRGKQFWFSPLESATLMYFTPPDGKITTVPLPPSAFGDSVHLLVTATSDGGLWIAGSVGEVHTQNIYHLTAQNKATVYTVHGHTSSSVAGTDGSLWYTYDGNTVSKISPDGVDTDFGAPRILVETLLEKCFSSEEFG